MAYLEFSNNGENKNKRMKIMIFTEGTILGPKSIFQHFNHASYIPIKNCVNIIKSWEEQGAEIIYITSRKKLKEVYEIKQILIEHNFSGNHLYYREKEQKYKHIVELVLSNIFNKIRNERSQKASLIRFLSP